jgi:tetratricopeptide (TPR) repeat protein
VVLALACTCQVVAMVLSQSRGPVLGFLAGTYVVVVYGLLRLRSAPESDSASTSTSAARAARWLVPAVIAVVLIGLLMVIALNARPSGPGHRGLEVPYLGRLVDVLDPESRTIKVRLLIWQGVVDLVSSGEPLTMPTGEADSLHRGRILVGYGPETFGLAINRFISPALGRVEQRTKTPDRAHNDLFDRLVTSGAVGVATWLAVYGALLALALRVLGFVRTRRDVLTLWIVTGLGATLGAVLPWLVSGRPVLSGIGLPVGLVTSLAVFLTGQTLVARADRLTGEGDLGVRGIGLALLAATVAHLVEIHVGIPITATKLYFWVGAAVLLVIGTFCFRSDPSDAGSEERRSRPAGDRSPAAARLVWPLLVTALCLPWIFALTRVGAGLRSTGAVLAASWWDVGAASPSTLFWMVAATITLATVVARPGDATEEPSDRRTRRLSVVGTVLAVAVAAVVHSALTTRLVPSDRTTADVVDAACAAAAQYGVITWVVVALALAVGCALGCRESVSLPVSRPRSVLAVVLSLTSFAVVVVLIQRIDIDPIRADGLLKPASALAERDDFESALRLLDRARRLAPHEPMYALMQGRTAIEAAGRAPEEAARDRLFELAESSLQQARELAPLDPDHSANLARYQATRAHQSSSSRERARLLEAARDNYLAALRLRPTSVVFLNEYGRLLINMGRDKEVREVLERATELDSQYPEPYRGLAVYWERKAAAAMQRGDRAGSARALERALASCELAAVAQSDLEPFAATIKRLEGGLIRLGHPPPDRARMVELFGSDAETHIAMARALLEWGRVLRAARHAELAAELASDPDQRQRAADVRSQIRLRAGAGSAGD